MLCHMGLYGRMFVITSIVFVKREIVARISLFSRLSFFFMHFATHSGIDTNITVRTAIACKIVSLGLCIKLK